MGTLVDKMLKALIVAAYIGGSFAVHVLGVSAFLLTGDDDPEEPDPLMFEIIEPPPPDVPGVAIPSGEGEHAAPSDDVAPIDDATEHAETSSGNAPSTKKVRWRERLAKLDAAWDKKQKERAAQTRVLLAEMAFGDEGEGIFACDDKGATGEAEARVPSKSLARMAMLMPTGILNEAYLGRVGELWRGRQSDGRLAFDLALPAELLRVRTADPPHALVVLGRPDVQCQVRIAIGKDLFPVSFYGVPVHIVDEDDRVYRAVVDAQMNIDATVSMTVLKGRLPFTELLLAGASDVHTTLKGHQAIFRAFKALSND